MLVMGLDTSTDIGAIGLTDGNKLLGEINIHLHHRHSERLIQNIDYLLHETGYKIEELDGLAVGVGPGSFTGLRIGLTTIKTFVQVLELKVVGISTLDIIARNISQNKAWVVPVIDARRKRVYTALYRAKTGKIQLEKKWEDQVIEVDKLLNKLKKLNKEGPIYLVGNAITPYRDIFDQFSLQFRYGSVTANIPRGGVIAELGYYYFEQGRQDDYKKLFPNYLKKAQGNN